MRLEWTGDLAPGWPNSWVASVKATLIDGQVLLGHPDHLVVPHLGKVLYLGHLQIPREEVPHPQVLDLRLKVVLPCTE